jgi:tRNA dimethylallyltransferase
LRPHSGHRFLILVGATGVGKSEAGFHLAKLIDGEIISADSRLVYRGMDIGTAKPSRRMREEIPHHFIDVVDPDEDYTCKMFEEEGGRAIREILERGKIPLVVGGTGLYVRALTQGIFEGPERDETLRARLKREAEAGGRKMLWERLTDVDPEKARVVDPENLVRVIRALEVYELMGRPMSELEREAVPIDIPYVKLGLSRRRDELYRIIDRRVDAMLEAGLVGEVRGLVEKGYGNTKAIRASLGYEEVMSYLEGTITYPEAVRLIKRNTRHFAKRQATWFKKEKDITWFGITGRTDFPQIAQELRATLM